MPTVRDLPHLAHLAAFLGAAVLLAACESTVSLKEPPRRATLPAPLPAPPAPQRADVLPAPVQPLPQAVPMPVPATPSQAPVTPPVEPPLVAEQRWLTQWFTGAPVVIAMQGDGALRVEVPIEFSFDAGAALVKPALAAVLDRVATSTRRVDGRLLIETPADTDAGSAQRLALDRATSVRQHLVARGVGPQRISDAPPGRGTLVVLNLSAAAP